MREELGESLSSVQKYDTPRNKPPPLRLKP